MNLFFAKFQSSLSHSNLEKYSKLPAPRELSLCFPRVLSCYVPHWCPTERHLTPGGTPIPIMTYTGTFFRLQVYERLGILKRPKRADRFIECLSHGCEIVDKSFWLCIIFIILRKSVYSS